MAVQQLEALLRSENVRFQSIQGGVMAAVSGYGGDYDVRCTPFKKDGVRVQILFPQNKSADLVSMKLLCKELTDYVGGVEFGYFAEHGNFCLSAYVALDKGIRKDLDSLAGIANRLLPLLDIAEKGELFTQNHLYLAFAPEEHMFHA